VSGPDHNEAGSGAGGANPQAAADGIITPDEPRTPPAPIGSALQANVIVAAGTALSRLTGFARFAVFGIIFGRAALWDAYNAANNSPNMVYELLVGGVLSATLVPVFTSLFHDQDDRGVRAVVGTSIVALLGLTGLAVALAPWIFRISSFRVSDSVDASDYRSLGASLARIFLIQILFYGLSAIWGGLLNARRRFFAPAWAPILSNIAIIVSLVLARVQIDGSADSFVEALRDSGFRYTLAGGATVGIALQALALLPALRSAGVSIRPHLDLHHPAVRTVFRMSAWTFGFAAANVTSAQVVQNLAKPGSGDASAYTLAYTFFQLPHALLAMSILTTFIPDLAASVRRRDRFAFVDRMTLGIRTIALITVPAGFGLFVLRRPILGALLEHGSFDALDSLVTSRALGGFALGLGGFSIYMFVLRGFYSHQDTKTPFKINLVQNLLNIVLAVALVAPYGVLGLGLAFALSYVVCAAWAIQVLDYKVRGFELRRTFVAIGKTVLASIIMAEAIWVIGRIVGSNAGIGAGVRIVLGIIIGIPVYGVLMWLLGSPELNALLRIVRRRLRPDW